MVVDVDLAPIVPSTITLGAVKFTELAKIAHRKRRNYQIY
jgi:hypothetical protein